MSVKDTKYKHCNNIIKFFNNIYDNYKSKKNKHNIKNCITKIHSYSVDTIKIKFPNKPSFNIDIDKDDNIYLPLSFIISNLNEEQFTQKIYNDYAFKALQLILSIFETYDDFHKIKKSKKLLDNIKVFDKIDNIMEIGIYKFSLPNKLQLTFDIKGLHLGLLTIKKLYKIKKNKNLKKIL
jgi:hypothetical protein